LLKPAWQSESEDYYRYLYELANDLDGHLPDDCDHDVEIIKKFRGEAVCSRCYRVVGHWRYDGQVQLTMRYE
jgi:hypothetical protein